MNVSKNVSEQAREYMCMHEREREKNWNNHPVKAIVTLCDFTTRRLFGAHACHFV